MALIETDIVENQGLDKELDIDSLDLIVGVMQSDIYNFPIESSIRETFSNSDDANKEKDIALDIIVNGADVSEYYQESDGRSITKASVFNEDYYTPIWLSDKSYVDVVYTEGPGKDEISFRDHGVGLSDVRLAGFFKVGESSKRLNTKGLKGKFGFGAKSPLATNIEFYTMESWYNGKYTKFMIYDKFFKCIIPKDGSTLATIIKGKRKGKDAEELVYWTDTKELNGVRISWEVKKHNKNKYFDAVKSQLLYFQKSLSLTEVSVDGSKYKHVNIFPRILFEDDTLIVTDGGRFTRPHILINRVNYGMLDENEMGINKLFGAVAIKAEASDLDITAARESVKWTDKTKNFIIHAVEKAAKVAGELVLKAMNDVKNPIEKYTMTSKYTEFFSHNNENSDKLKMLEQLKSFSGKFSPKVIIDGEDFKRPGVKVDFSVVNNFTEELTLITCSRDGNRISTAYSDNWHSFGEFKNVFYIPAEYDNTLRISLIQWLTKAGSRYSTVKFVVFKKVSETPVSFKKFIVGLSIEDEAKGKRAYKVYLVKFGKRREMRALLRDVVRKFSINIESINMEDVRKFAKDMRILNDEAIRKNGSAGTVNTTVTSVKAEADIRAEYNRQLKREKKVLPYKVYTPYVNINREKSAFVHSYQTGYYTMEEHNTDAILESSSNIIYSDSEGKPLLEHLAIIGKLVHDNSQYLNKNITDNVFYNRFITISKQNYKFFKQMKNGKEIKEYIKPVHKVENGVLTLELGEDIVSFLTVVYLHKLMHTNYLYNFMYNFSELLLLEDKIPNDVYNRLSKAHKMLEKFPSPIKMAKDDIETYSAEYANVVAMRITQSQQTSKEFLESLMGIAKLQELPIHELDKDTQEGLKGIIEIKVIAYDKGFIEHLVVDLAELRPVLHLLPAIDVNRNMQVRNRDELRNRYLSDLSEGLLPLYKNVALGTALEDKADEN